MSKIMPMMPIALNDDKTVYNAVKIKINNPQANIPEGLENSENSAEYNAISLEVNRPELNVYSYPECDSCVTSENMAGYFPSGIQAKQLPPPSYQTNLINNRTFINAEFEIKNKKHEKAIEDAVIVPEPNITTVEKEKGVNEITFNGLSFKAAPSVEVASDANIKSSVNINEVLNKLKGNDYDIQALQLEEIAKAALDEKDNSDIIPFLTSGVFHALDDIISKDTLTLTHPNEEQTEARKKIIINEIFKAQTLAQNPDTKIEDIALPYEITESDIAKATELSPFEMAERNKEYGIYALAGLIKTYSEEFEKQIGDIVPLTDLPCISSIVETLKNSENPDLKIAAVNALMIIQRPEYNEEIGALLRIASNDENPDIAQYSAMAAGTLNRQ